jgi:hypothetical protein
LGIGRQALFFVTLACVLPGVAWGSVVATDDIGYPDGAINPNGGTGSWLGGWTGSGVQIESGEIVTVATSTPPLYAARAFAQPNTGDLFVRFDLTLPPSVALGDYLGASLSTGVNNPILTWGKPEGSPELFVGNSLLVSSGIAAVADSTVQLVAAYQRTPGPSRIGCCSGSIRIRPTSTTPRPGSTAPTRRLSSSSPSTRPSSRCLPRSWACASTTS